MENFPPVITLRITSRCNNDCRYCFGPKDKKELDLSNLKKIFRLLSKNGAKAVVLTGGEPTMREDFDKILQELKKNKLSVFLDTNGDLFFEHSGAILAHVDVIGLPVDFPGGSYRNEDNFKAVFAALDHIASQKNRPMIRIGTVVTRDNFEILEKIGQILTKYPIDVWKLYQFTPQAVSALKNRSSLEIPQKDFDRVARKISGRFRKNFKVVISSRKDRNRAYFFLDPDGTVFIPNDDMHICRQVKVGRILDQNIVSKWRRVVLKNNYRENIKLTFNSQYR